MIQPRVIKRAFLGSLVRDEWFTLPFSLHPLPTLRCHVELAEERKWWDLTEEIYWDQGNGPEDFENCRPFPRTLRNIL